MKLKILPLLSQYILSCLIFVIKIKKQYMAISEVYHIDMRQHLNLHKLSPNLITKYQKGVCCLHMKVFNVLLSYIKSLRVLRD
jgi:hypothetical protein